MTRNAWIGIGALVVIVLLILAFGFQTNLLKTQVPPGAIFPPGAVTSPSPGETALDPEKEECQCKCVYNAGQPNESQLCKDLARDWSNFIRYPLTEKAQYYCENFVYRPAATTREQCLAYNQPPKPGTSHPVCDGYFIRKDQYLEEKPPRSGEGTYRHGSLKSCAVVVK